MSFKEYVNSIRGKSEPVSTPRSSFADYVNNIKFQQAQQQAQEKAQKEAEELWKYATDYKINAYDKYILKEGDPKFRVSFNPVAVEGTESKDPNTRFVSQEQYDAIMNARKEIEDYYQL